MDALLALHELRAPLHIMLHVLVPAFVAAVFARGRVVGAFVIMMATMLVDLDHLLAVPIYAANRCSIWFHPLHTGLPIIIYGLMMCWPLFSKSTGIVKGSRVIGWLGGGLVIHMLLDALDCLWMRCAAG
ncbi:MAG: DUF6122 family protein [Bermanella sp.]